MKKRKIALRFRRLCGNQLEKSQPKVSSRYNTVLSPAREKLGTLIDGFRTRLHRFLPILTCQYFIGGCHKANEAIGKR